MPDDEEESLEVRFLKANANKDYMAGVLADCIRNCMRGVASSSDPTSAGYRATQEFLQLLKLMRFAGDDIRVGQLFADAIDDIRPKRTDDIFNEPEHAAHRYFEWTIDDAAMTGMQFVVEKSCHDNAAKGRAGRRKSDFLSSLRQIDEARRSMNEDWDKRRAKDAAAGVSAKDRALATLAAAKSTNKARKARKKV